MSSLAPRRPLVLIILDGFGVNPAKAHNAVVLAHTPNFDYWFSHHPVTVLQASGLAVGLPDGQMGNSEVGHLTLGCGEIMRQDLVVIDQAISDGSFFENPVFCQAMQRAKEKYGHIHLLGLVSDGGVHSHVRHALALVDLCRRLGVKPYMHIISDGRDTPPRALKAYLGKLLQAIFAADGKVVSLCGRYYAMDRDNRWDRVERAWRAIAKADAPLVDSIENAINSAYAEDIGDEFIKPVIFDNQCAFASDEEVIFFNFRKDRARQLTAALFREQFEYFERSNYSPARVTCMTEYDEWFRLDYAFTQDRPHHTLSDLVSRANLQQFHCAETEKYAHVTYFFNGRHGDAYSGEERVIVPSPKVATYDQAPAMSAKLVADQVIGAIQAQTFGFIAVNFANGDMVGHTGVETAAIEAVECLDREVGRVLHSAQQAGYSIILTADHGNCEMMRDPINGEPHTQHTVFPVPCMVVDETPWHLSLGAGLNAIAPTVLQLMGLTKPSAMKGDSLLLKPVA